jgi:hypothetical protein
VFLLREEDEERESNDARLNDPLLPTSSRRLCSAEVEQDRPPLTVVLVDTRKFIRRAIQLNRDEGCCQSLSTLKRDGKVLAKKAGLAMGAWRVQHAMVVATSSYSLVVPMVNLQNGPLTRTFPSMPLSPQSACIIACVLSAGLIVISSSSLLKDMGFQCITDPGQELPHHNDVQGLVGRLQVDHQPGTAVTPWNHCCSTTRWKL